ncbi:MAG TPA: amino acid permease [Thermoanaerobaculia bacterium]
MTAPLARDRISVVTAASICVANMIGTGVFASLGFQVAEVTSGFALLTLWVAGGVFALCGAFSYGELAAALPRSGGELHFLTRSIHPLAGFLAGWVSLTVGFAPPIALVAITFGEYFSRVAPGAPPLALSCTVVALVTLFHLRDLRLGSSFQNLFTGLKVALILVFIALPLWTDERSGIDFAPRAGDLGVIFSPVYGVSLLFVLYAYTGWNAATYVVGEIRDPTRNVPRALAAATGVVMALYVGIHWSFLVTTPISELAPGGVPEVEVGHLVAARVFGEAGGRWMSGLLCVALVSSISAMTWAGPRVTQVLGEDYAMFRALARTNPAGIPVRAILLQTAFVFVMLLTSTFKSILVFVQLILTLSSALTVLGVVVLRRRAPDLPRPYRAWGYPATPLLFLAISVFAMGYTFYNQPWESLAGLAILLLGLPLFWLSPRAGEAAA